MPRSGRQVSRKATAVPDVSKISNRQWKAKTNEQDDLSSRTTAASDSGSEQDWLCAGPMPKTSLKSLKSKAKPFVPTEELGADDIAAMLPPCMPTPGKDSLTGIIQSTLGGEVWNLNMMDGVSYSGDWFTAVEITIPELSASMCHLVTSGDAEAITAARESSKAQAIQALTQALQKVKPGMVLQPTEEGVQICVEYCAADRTKLCRDFSHFGSCPRSATCRWKHAMIELFMINFVVAPLSEWGSNIEAVGTPAVGKQSKTCGRWQPTRLPKAPSQETKPVYSPDDSSNNTTDTGDAGQLETIKPLLPNTRARNSGLKLRLVSPKKLWCDIEDEDDDVACNLFGQTP